MPKMTILDMTQDILSDMESDEVNSINDTVESLEVAQIIKSTYYSIIDGKDWPHLYRMFQLTSSGDNNLPTYMTLPERVSDLAWVKYDAKEFGETREKYRKLTFKNPEEFMKELDARDSDQTYITVMVDPVSSVPLNIYNDRAPLYYTSFDNEHIILDAYDVAVDSTSQSSKTQCFGKFDPVWTMDDSFIPDLPANAFSYLLNEAKSTCFLRIKQAPDQKSEQHSISQRRRMSQQAWRVNGGIQYGDYGRKGKK